MESKPHSTQKPYPAEKARQGEIILRRPWQRIVFFGGLVGVVVLGALTRAFGIW